MNLRNNNTNMYFKYKWNHRLSLTTILIYSNKLSLINYSYILIILISLKSFKMR